MVLWRHDPLIIGCVQSDRDNLMWGIQSEEQAKMLVGSAIRLPIFGLVPDLIRIQTVPREPCLADGCLWRFSTFDARETAEALDRRRDGVLQPAACFWSSNARLGIGKAAAPWLTETRVLAQDRRLEFTGLLKVLVVCAGTVKSRLDGVRSSPTSTIVMS